MNLSKLKSSIRRSHNDISPSQVNEESLQVWLNLPSTIRRDPSLVSFQLEHERLHGHVDDVNDISPAEAAPPDQDADIELESNDDSDKSDYINMHHNHPATECVHKNDNSGTTKWTNVIKTSCFIVVWSICTFILAGKDDKIIPSKHIVISEMKIQNDLTKFAIPEMGMQSLKMPNQNFGSEISVILEGPLLSEEFLSKSEYFLYVGIDLFRKISDNRTAYMKIPTLFWKIPIVDSEQFDTVDPVIRKKRFDISTLMNSDLMDYESGNYYLRMIFQTNSKEPFTVKLNYDTSPISVNVGVIYGGSILILLYLLIGFEVVHRTFAAILASICSIAVLAFQNDKPSMEDIMGWIDIETILLLFSMMIIISILTETGVFDFFAVFTFKITNGKIWPLIHCLCLITTLVSSVLDNVTTVLLMTPISIRLCEVMHLNPLPIMMAIAIHTNIGGMLTPVGDPASAIITSNQYIAKHGVTFLKYVMHISFGVILVCIQTAIQLRIQYRDIHDLRLKESKEIKELRREIIVWKRAAASLSLFSKNVTLVRETLLTKLKILNHKLKKLELSGTTSNEEYKCTLEELKHSYPIKNKTLLIKSGFVLLFVLSLFFLQSLPIFGKLSAAWCALLGVVLLLIIAERDDMDALMHRIEWTTLLFLAAMFVIMDCLVRMGLINWIGKQTEIVIYSVGEDARLAVAIIIIIWVSAITSAFVDTVLITAMMIKVVVSLAENPALGLPIQPLVWAVAFGSSLGGNGTLYGASANVVCVGIAEQHGYNVTFMDYLKLCFPIMIGNIIVVTGYLMLCHAMNLN